MQTITVFQGFQPNLRNNLFPKYSIDDYYKFNKKPAIYCMKQLSKRNCLIKKAHN